MPASVSFKVATMFSIMLSIRTSRNPESIISEILAIITSRNVSNRNPANIFSEILAIKNCGNVGNYNFPKYWQLAFPKMLTILFFRNTGDKC